MRFEKNSIAPSPVMSLVPYLLRVPYRPPKEKGSETIEDIGETLGERHMILRWSTPFFTWHTEDTKGHKRTQITHLWGQGCRHLRPTWRRGSAS
jgi:hypothetical protein